MARDKSTFPERVRALGVDVNLYDRVAVYPQSGEHVIPNTPGKQGSLQVYVFIIGDKGYISPKDAVVGLAVFGQELREEAMSHDNLHPNINLLEKIASSSENVRAEVVRK